MISQTGISFKRNDITGPVPRSAEQKQENSPCTYACRVGPGTRVAKVR